MLIATLNEFFERDLNRLKNEISLYTDEQKIWAIESNILNSAGNLCLHLIGNLNAYIGVGLAKTSYVRERDLEFSTKGVPRQQLLKMIDDTLQVVRTGMKNLSENDLGSEFPVKVWDKTTGMEYTLIHLATHLNYHLGQINYHRRLLDNQQ